MENTILSLFSIVSNTHSNPFEVVFIHNLHTISLPNNSKVRQQKVNLLQETHEGEILPLQLVLEFCLGISA